VLHSIEVANNIGLGTGENKDTVILKGINDDEILDFARKTITDGWNVRFIGHMPFAGAKKQDNDLVSSQEIMDVIPQAIWNLISTSPYR